MPTIDSPDDLKQNETDPSQSNLLERPLAKAFIHRVSRRLSEEKFDSPKPQPLTATEKITTVVLPALLVSGLGVLAVLYPHFLDDFDLHYLRGNDLSVCFLFLLVLFIKLAWNQVGGSVAIALSLLAIIRCLLPNRLKPNDSELSEHKPPDEIPQKTLQQEAVHIGLQAGMKVSKNFIQRRRGRRSQGKK